MTTKIPIDVGVSFYNDPRSLYRCLNSLRDFRRIFCIDGRYKGSTFPTPLSSELTRDIVKQFPNTILIDAPDLLELEKRNTYLNLAGEYGSEWLLVVDSDEYVQGDTQFFWENVQKRTNEHDHLYCIPVQEVGTESFTKIPLFGYRARLYRKPYELETVKCHWILKVKGTPDSTWLRPQYHGEPIDGIRLGHDHKMRDADYMQKRLEFQIQQHKYETGVNLITLEHEADVLERIKKELLVP